MKTMAHKIGQKLINKLNMKWHYLILVFLIVSCNEKNNIKYEYYETGEIRKKVTYSSFNDTSSLMSFEEL